MDPTVHSVAVANVQSVDNLHKGHFTRIVRTAPARYMLGEYPWMSKAESGKRGHLWRKLNVSSAAVYPICMAVATVTARFTWMIRKWHTCRASHNDFKL